MMLNKPILRLCALMANIAKVIGIKNLRMSELNSDRLRLLIQRFFFEEVNLLLGVMISRRQKIAKKIMKTVGRSQGEFKIDGSIIRGLYFVPEQLAPPKTQNSAQKR